MKVIKDRIPENNSRVVQRFALLPKLLSNAGEKSIWIWFRSYYQLQLDSHWGYGWMNLETSLDKNAWEFKWDKKYLALWK